MLHATDFSFMMPRLRVTLERKRAESRWPTRGAGSSHTLPGRCRDARLPWQSPAQSGRGRFCAQLLLLPGSCPGAPAGGVATQQTYPLPDSRVRSRPGRLLQLALGRLIPNLSGLFLHKKMVLGAEAGCGRVRPVSYRRELCHLLGCLYSFLSEKL